MEREPYARIDFNTLNAAVERLTYRIKSSFQPFAITMRAKQKITTEYAPAPYKNGVDI